MIRVNTILYFFLFNFMFVRTIILFYFFNASYTVDTIVFYSLLLAREMKKIAVEIKKVIDNDKYT